MNYSDIATLAWPKERDACGVGFIADRQGNTSRRIVELALDALCNLDHRGAVSADGLTGDGAGVLTQIPVPFFRRQLSAMGVDLAEQERFGIGVFFVANDAPVDEMYDHIDNVVAASELSPLAWREVPVDDEVLGEVARMRRPVIRQLFIKSPAGFDQDAFERQLYLLRKRIERRLGEAGLGRFYIPSFSSRTISYKGLMVAPQLSRFYLDLADTEFTSAIAVFHQRYSTNTLPRWSLAQPFRFLAHNGEINTLQGNVNFMRSREPVLKSTLWGGELRDLLPIIEPGGSDSAALDNAFELLTLSGRDPMHALMMLVPEAFEEHGTLDPELRGFYEYHASLMEPWDGPAALAMSDGRYALAALDRNGLRPQRYWISRDGLVVVGSEAGMVPIAEEEITEKGRLGPGMMLAVDTKTGRLLHDHDIKREYSRKRPYTTWVERHLVCAPQLADSAPEAWDAAALLRAQTLFGYHQEEYDRIFEPMVFEADIPVGSMGDDTPLAVLSEQPQQLYRYFKQRFAQVTNPPIDPLRERLVMSLETVIGPRASILEELPEAAQVIKFAEPIISEAELGWLRQQAFLAPSVVPLAFPVTSGPEGLEPAVEALCDQAVAKVEAGAGLLILSDRECGPEQAPIPALLATAAVHHRLLRAGLRTRTAIVVESGEPREDHHFACLIGYGAALICPYLAFASVRDVVQHSKRGHQLEPAEAVANYRKALNKGLLKIMSKMGISAVSSYRGAQIFEAVGIDQGVIDRYFSETPSRIGGVKLPQLATDQLRFHAEAYGEAPALQDRGIYRYRKTGEYHAFNPLVFKSLHKAVRSESFEAYQKYTGLVDERPPCNLRDLIDYQRAESSVPLEEVEPIEAIVRRFTTQAMSHGAVSRETHETLAVAMNRLGAKSNSGEGGEDAGRFQPYERDVKNESMFHGAWHPRAGDWGNSAIKQVASGRFGVTPEYLVSGQELEIKMAQGSKPGEGGQIPGHKVNDEIAHIRRSVPGVTLISPPPHHDIYSIEDLAQLIYDLKRVNKEARVGVKLVSTAGVGTIAAGVAKGYADNIQISGFDGGTGASPLASIKHVGVPWELGLSETQQVLIENNLRGRVTLRVDGGMKTGRDVVIAALLGAEEFGFGTAALVAAGCAMIRQCHLNTCPVGVATQREDLRAKYQGEPEHIIRFLTYVAQQVRMILAEMGVRSLDEIIGQVSRLRVKTSQLPKVAGLDLSAILRDPDPSGSKPRRSEQRRNDRPEEVTPLDEIIWRECWDAVKAGVPVRKHYTISTRERTVGARLSGEIARLYHAEGLRPGTVQLHFTGSAGQSFGAFNNRGMSLVLEGEAQDYVGKGMYGGEIVLRQRSGSPLVPHEQVIAGNTALYGATGGNLYLAGQAGERFCVRNSGAKAVVEGIGDHGCEYMTGGVAVILGPTGRNFGAGMSGGVAYVLDLEGSFETRYNPAMVGLEPIASEVDESLLRAMIERHAALTGSVRARQVLSDWPDFLARFWKVSPHPSREDATAEEHHDLRIEREALETILAEARESAAVSVRLS